ncbi:hypothetical protein ACS0TY_030948 [Phlomoides rotata]
MMTEAEGDALNLKVVINKQKTRVLFAEIDNDFADVLFSFLIVPLGKVMYALEKHYREKTPHVIGSLNSLYHGLANLQTFKFQYFGRKPSFLNINGAYAFPFLNQKYPFDHGCGYFLDQAYFLVLKGKAHVRVSSLLNEFKVSPSDVEEVEYFQIGLEGARNILKASLMSTHAISDDGLNNSKFIKQPRPVFSFHVGFSVQI